MNKAHRSIWNASLGAWVAAPETAKVRGKNNARTGAVLRSVRFSLKILTASLLLALSGQALALVSGGDTTYHDPGTNAASESNYPYRSQGITITANQDQYSKGEDLLLAGGGHQKKIRQYFRGNNDGDGVVITIGHNGFQNDKLKVGTFTYSDTDTNNTISNNLISIIGKMDMNEQKIIRVANGTEPTDAVNFSQIQTYFHTANGSTGAAVGGDATTNVGTPYQSAGATGGYSIAAGYAAKSQGANSIAIGRNSSVSTTGSNSIAMGYGAVVSDNAINGTMAIGAYSKAEGSQSIAIGGSNKPSSHTYAKGGQSIAIGGDTLAEGESSIAIGGDDTDVATSTSVTITNSAGQSQNMTVAQAFTELTGGNLQSPRYKSTTSSGLGSIALGVKSVASKHLSTAVGTAAKAEGVMATAFGVGASASKENSVALGSGSTTDVEGTSQKGTTINGTEYSWAGGTKVNAGDIVSVGNTNYERQIKNVAAGAVTKESTDAINGSQLYSVAEKLDRKNYFHTNATGSVQAGNETNLANPDGIGGAKGVNTIAAGQNATAKMRGSIAMGFGASTTGENTDANGIAIGTSASSQAGGAVALGYDAKATFINATALGSQSKATGFNAINIGNNNGTDEGAGATKSRAIAIGLNTSATGDSSTAIGWLSKTTQTDAVALGTNSSATLTGAVALGSNSETDAYATKVDGTGTTIGMQTYDLTFAGEENVKAGDQVSVGKLGEERQIKNVAPGAITAISTDAINGSQLYAVAKELDRNTYVHVNDGTATQPAGSPTTNLGSVDAKGGATGADAIAIGKNVQAVGNQSFAMGYESYARKNSSLAIGFGAEANNTNSVAMGINAKTAGEKSVAIGVNAGSLGTAATVQNKGLASMVSIGNGAGSGTVNNNFGVNIGLNAGAGYNSDSGEGVAIGKYTGINETNKKTGNTNTAISSNAGQNTLGHNNVAMGINAGGNNKGSGNIAIGKNAAKKDATGEARSKDNLGDFSDTVALGSDTVVAAANAMAMGNKAIAVGANSMALGSGSQAKVENAVALGSGSQATTDKDVAGYDPATGEASTLETGVWKSTSGAVSVGDSTKNITRQITSVAAGTQNTDAVNVAQLKAVAELANRDTYFHTNATGAVVAYDNTATNKGKLSDTAGAFGINSLAAGENAHAVGGYSSAIGYTAKAYSNNATAIGNNAQAGGADDDVENGQRATAIGTNTKATGSDSVALAYEAEATGINTVAIGTRAESTGTVGASGGESDLAGYSTAIGGVATATGQYSSAIGYKANAINEYATAVGTNAQATGINSIAIGGTTVGDESATATASGSIAIGRLSDATQDNATAVGLGAQATGVAAAAYGKNSNASGESATAVGDTAKALATNASAFGSDAIANTAESVALGFNSATGGSSGKSVAIGSGSRALEVNSIALGSGSNADRAAGANGYNPMTGAVDTTNADIVATKSTLGALSIGSAGNTRQIINVAAGTNNTDAVNVAQLKSVANIANKGWGIGNDDAQTASVIGNVAPGERVDFVSADDNTVTVAVSDDNNGKSKVAIGVKTSEITTADGVASTTTETSLATAGEVVDAINASSFKIGANQAESSLSDADKSIQAGETLAVQGGLTDYSKADAQNISTKISAKDTISIALAKELKNLTSVEVVDGTNSVTTTATGITIKGGTKDVVLGNTGLNNGGNQITNVASGGTLSDTNDNAANIADIYNATTALTNTGFGVNADTGGLQTHKLGKELAITAGNTTEITSTDNLLTTVSQATDGKTTVAISMKEQPKFKGVELVNATDASKTTTLTSNADGNLDVGGDKITNVADGTAGNDAVNVSQLNKVAAAAKVEVNSADKSVTVKTTTNTDGSKDVDLAVNADGKTIEVASDGKVQAVTSEITTTNGVAAAATGTSLVTAKTVVDAVNASGFTAKANGDTGQFIKSGDSVDFINGDNIAISRTDGKFTIGTTKAVNFDKVTVGDVVIDNTTGINAGNKQITNVASGGTTVTNAANIGDVNNAAAAAKTEVKAGTNVAVAETKGADEQTIYTINADGVSVSTADADALTVTAGTKDVNNITDYKLDLGAKTKASLAKADSALQSIVTQIDGVDVKTLKQGDNIANFITGDNIVLSNDNDGIKIATKDEVSFKSVTIGDTSNNTKLTSTANGLDVGGDKITNVADGTADNDAVNVNQLNKVAAAAKVDVNSADKSVTVNTTTNTDGSKVYDLSVNVDGTTIEVATGGKVQAKTSEITTANGVATATTETSLVTAKTVADAVNASGFTAKANGDAGQFIKSGDSVEFADGNNIEITRDKGKFTIGTKPEVSFDKVTIGNVVIDKTSNKITGLADGDVSENSTDAVNGGQLHQLKSDLAGWTDGAGGFALTGGDSKMATQSLGKSVAVVGDKDADADKGNITTTTDETNKKLTINLAKDLQDLSSVSTVDAAGNSNVMNAAGNTITDKATGDTHVSNVSGSVMTDQDGNKTEVSANGITITPKTGGTAQPVSLTDKGLNNGGNQITNVQSGLVGADGKAVPIDKAKGDMLHNAATIGDVSLAIGSSTGGGAQDADGNPLVDENGNPITAQQALTTYSVKNRREKTNNTVVSAIRNMNEGGIKYFHTNNTANNYETLNTDSKDDSSAGGAYSTAVGYQAVSDGESSLAIGHGAEATGRQSIAIGMGNQVTGNHSGAIGDPSIIRSDHSYSVGNNNEVGANSSNVFVLGNDVRIGADGSNVSGAVALGNRAEVRTAGSVALGEGSVAGAAHTGNYTVGGKRDAQVAGARGNAVRVVAVGSAGNERQIQHVAPGVVAANSTDAVNGSQLYMVEEQAVKYDTNDDGSVNKNSIVLEGDVYNPQTGTGGTRITNLAAGVNPSDAVNVDQVNRALNGVSNQLNNRINAVQTRANAGTAAAMAVAGLPQAYLPGKSMMAIAGSTYEGESGYAVGFSSISEGGNWVVKATGSGNSRGQYGATVGAGYQW